MRPSIYASLCITLGEIKKLLTREEGRLLYARAKDRLAKLATQSKMIGWGYGDYVGDVVEELDRLDISPALRYRQIIMRQL